MEVVRPSILVPGVINPHVLKRVGREFRLVTLPEADAELLDSAQRSQIRGIAAMTRISAGFIDAFDGLEIIANFGVGYDAVDADHAARKGIMVTNTPDVLTDEVADSTIALILNTLRAFPKAESYLREGRWEREGIYPLTPLTLRGRTAGIFGLGRIGLAIAKRLEGFSIPIHYHNRSRRDDVGYPYHDSLESLAQAVDLLICVVPGGGDTDGSIDKSVLSHLGENGVFINVGRGTTVDEPALIHALQTGIIAAAGLDVFAREPHVPQELIDLPNACLLPHVASASEATRRAMADLVVDNLAAWFDGKPALTPVPETAAFKR